MDSSAIPVFLAGPFPVLHTARLQRQAGEVELDVALLIGGLPTILAATSFPLDETWDRIDRALASGEARLGVAGVRQQAESGDGNSGVYPSAYVGVQCANGERLVLAHIRGPDPNQEPDAYAREVFHAILQGQTPAELGEFVDD
ncbi:MAG: hypothetical protein HY703_04355 [Gemmatimonadetes bacterium]|nr:hypothetical protein [Gemmatimonadota bacterium]